MKRDLKKYGFTLAETLITLAIISIVASLTIPSMIVKYQKEQTVKQLKVGYQILQEALNRAIIDHGPTKNWDFSGNYTTDKPYNILNTYFRPYMKVQMYCGVTGIDLTTKGVCNGVLREWAHGSLVLANGMSVTVQCGTGTSLGSMNIILDLNGKNKPNKTGRDRFYFQVNAKNKIIPFGPSNAFPVHNCVYKNPTGFNNSACSYKIINDGWQIKDDYPW